MYTAQVKKAQLTGIAQRQDSDLQQQQKGFEWEKSLEAALGVACRSLRR